MVYATFWQLQKQKKRCRMVQSEKKHTFGIRFILFHP